MSEHTTRDNLQVLPPEIPEAGGETKKRCLIKLNSEKVNEGLRFFQSVKDNPDFRLKHVPLYREAIAPGFEFTVFAFIDGNGKISVLYFAVSPEGFDKPTDDELADLSFNFDSENQLVNLADRLNTEKGKAFGLSGSNILAESEKYIREFLSFNEIAEQYKYFEIDSGQVEVNDWAVRNGYHLKFSEDQEEYEKTLTSNNSDFIISDQNKRPDGSGAGYIYRTKKNDDGSVGLGKMVRFTFVKDIWPEEEKK